MDEVIDEVIEINDESDQNETTGSIINRHCTKVMQPIKNGKRKGNGVNKMHFKCNYCDKSFAGPSNSSVSIHLRKEHRSKCNELVQAFEGKRKSKRNFFDPVKMRGPFDVDVFMGLLLKWIVRSDQPFSTVDDKDFVELLEYLKNYITVNSRRTLMRRLDELYEQRKEALKNELKKIKSK